MTEEEASRLNELVQSLRSISDQLKEARDQRYDLEQQGLTGISGSIRYRGSADEVSRPAQLGSLLHDLAFNLRSVDGAVDAGEVLGVPLEVQYVPARSLSFLATGSQEPEHRGESEETKLLDLVAKDVEPIGLAHLKLGSVRISVPISFNYQSNGVRIVRMLERIPGRIEQCLASIESKQSLLAELERRARAPFAQEQELRDAIERKGQVDRAILENEAQVTPEIEAEIMRPVAHMVHARSGRPVHPAALKEWEPPAALARVDEANVQAEDDLDQVQEPEQHRPVAREAIPLQLAGPQ